MNPKTKQQNEKTTIDTTLPHLTIGFLQSPHEHLMCIMRALYEFLPTASQRFPQSGCVISSEKPSQVLGDHPLQTPSQPRRWPKLLEFVVGSKAPIVHLSPLRTSCRRQLGWWLHLCCPLPSRPRFQQPARIAKQASSIDLH